MDRSDRCHLAIIYSQRSFRVDAYQRLPALNKTEIDKLVHACSPYIYIYIYIYVPGREPPPSPPQPPLPPQPPPPPNPPPPLWGWGGGVVGWWGGWVVGVWFGVGLGLVGVKEGGCRVVWFRVGCCERWGCWFTG